MQFTHPIFLWALTGLSIPIGIHLLSRKEGQVIRLGSLRHVHETSTQQFRGIRLNELLLLALRCLLIVLFTLIISGLHWNTPSKKKWLLVEMGLEHEPPLKLIVDSLVEDGYESHLLAESFPLLEDGDSISSTINYWSLLEKLQTKNLSDVIVFAQNRPNNFNGLRTTLPANVRWISYSRPSLDFNLQAVRIGGDSISMREGHTSSEATHFTTKKVSRSTGTPEVESRATIRIAMRSDEKYTYDREILEAALAVIKESFPIELILKEIPSTDPMPASDWIIWLSDKNVPEVVSNVLRIESLTGQNELLFQTKNNQWMITQRLNEEVALHENLTLKLAALLIPHEKLQTKANSNDRRVISDPVAWTPAQINSKNVLPGAVSKANPYLIVLLLLVMFLERVVAYKRNQ